MYPEELVKIIKLFVSDKDNEMVDVVDYSDKIKDHRLTIRIIVLFFSFLDRRFYMKTKRIL